MSVINRLVEIPLAVTKANHCRKQLSLVSHYNTLYNSLICGETPFPNIGTTSIMAVRRAKKSYVVFLGADPGVDE